MLECDNLGGNIDAQVGRQLHILSLFLPAVSRERLHFPAFPRWCFVCFAAFPALSLLLISEFHFCNFSILLDFSHLIFCTSLRS